MIHLLKYELIKQVEDRIVEKMHMKLKCFLWTTKYFYLFL